MGNSKPTSGSRLKLLLLALPVLLLAAVGANWTSIAQIARGEKNLKSIIYGRAGTGTTQVVGWKLPPDAGDPSAKVKIEVFVTPGDPCHHDTALLGQALGTLDKQRVRVHFLPGKQERREELKLGCEQGVAINGKTEFKVPDPENPGKKKTLFMTPEGHGLSTQNLYEILNSELAAAYDGKDLGMTPEGFKLHLENEVKWRLEKAVEEQKSKDSGGETG